MSENDDNDYIRVRTLTTKLARICLDFGQVQRITKHPDGELESDTTHTVMLILICCTIIREFRLPLDSGRVAELAAIHDLHEYKAGDTQTLRINAAEQLSKKQREEIVIDELSNEFDGSWLASSLNHYHAQQIPEARFIRAVDKLLPKLTHLINGCRVLREMRMTASEFHQRIMVDQIRDMMQYAGEFDCVMELHRRLGSKIESQLPNSY